MTTKQLLYQHCLQYVNKRLETVEKTILANQKALETETKSSAGDKHETGRAMLQLEMEKASQQLSGVTKMKEVLTKINLSKNSKTIHLGSIISTDKATFFLSISAGKLNVGGKEYFAISTASPIGKLLLGKQLHENVVFNGKPFKINRIM